MMKFIKLRVFAGTSLWTVGYCAAVACGFFSKEGLHLGLHLRKFFNSKFHSPKDDITAKQGDNSFFDLCSTTLKTLKDHG